MNNRFARIVCGFMSVVMFIFSALNIVPTISAAETAVEGVIDVTEYSATINGQEINDYMTVKNNDEFVLNLAWNVTSDAYEAPVTFKYDLKLKNVNLDGWSSQPISGNAKYYVQDGFLFIELINGSAGRRGTCNIKGTLDIAENSVDSNNKTVVGFIEKEFHPYTYQFNNNLWISKNSGSFRKVGSEYYQDFVVNIQNPSENDTGVIKFSDVFTTDADTSLYTGGIVDFAATSNFALNGTLALDANNSVTIDNIPANGTLQFTYSIKVDPAKALTGKDGKNTAVVNYTSNQTEKTLSSVAYANPSLPDVHKSGTVDTGNDKIDWTITVSPNMMNGAEVTLSDDYFDAAKAAEIAAVINASYPGAASASGDSVVLDTSKISSASCVINYSTPIPDSAKGSIFGTRVSNTVNAVFKSGTTIFNDEHTGYAAVSGSSDFISKSGQAPDFEGKLTWTVTVDVPNEPLLTSFNIYDNADAYSQTNVHNIDFNSFTFKIGGADVTGIKVVPKSSGREFDIYFGNTAKCQYDSNCNNFDTLGLKGKKLEITYKTIPVDTDYTVRTYKNTAQVWMKSDSNGEIPDSAEAVVTPDFEISKNGSYESWQSQRGYIKWTIDIAKKGAHTFNANDEIIITDTIPDKHYYVDGQTWASVEGVTITPVVTPQSDQDVVFTFTLSAQAADALNAGKKLSLSFVTAMTEADFSEMMFSSETDVIVKNTANVKIGSEDVDIAGTVKIPAGSERVLKKECPEATQIPNGNGTFSASYSITVNSDKLDIIPGTGAGKDTIVLTDKLGYFLSPEESTISITPSDGAGWSYNSTENVITFTLKDNTAYTITYDVTGKMVSPDNTISDENISALYDNTVILTGGNNESKESKTSILSKNYTSDSTYTFEISIRGKKMWSTEKTGYGDEILPYNIQVIIRRDTFDILDTLIESDYIVYNETVAPDADGNWIFNVTGLKNMETNGNRYDYKLEEVFVDGFTMGEVVKSGTPDKINFDWTNTFTAPFEEYGRVQVNKSWDDNNNSGNTRPDEITLYLKTADGKTIVDTKVVDVSGGNTSAVFEKVPLYDYLRDASGKLVRTPRRYIIEEKAVDGYKSVTSAVFTLTDASTAGLVIDTPKVIAVTNTLGSNPSESDKPSTPPSTDSNIPQPPSGTQPGYTTPSGNKPSVTTAAPTDDGDEPVSTTAPADKDEPVSTTAPADEDEPASTTAPADDESEPVDTTAPADSSDEEETAKKTTASENKETETGVDGSAVTEKTTSEKPHGGEADSGESTAVTTKKPVGDEPELTTDRYTGGSDSSADFEENPGTGVSTRLVFLGALALGILALLPRKKK